MGADIHAYVEYAAFQTEGGKDYWKAITSNFGSRNYYLFGLLAEVRGDGPALYPVRGMPADGWSYQTSGGYWVNVTDEPSLAQHEGWASVETAERWVSEQDCVADLGEDGKLRRVSHPDWHSHSWLTTDELGKVLEYYAANVQSVWPAVEPDAPVEWRAILAAMRTFETAGKKARVVFWFDN